MKIIFIILALVLLAGCSNAQTLPENQDSDTVTVKLPTDNSTVFKKEISDLEARLLKKQEDIQILNNQAIQLQNQVIQLQNEITAIKISNALSEAQVEAMQDDINRAFEAYTVDSELIEAMNEELIILQDRLNEINGAINAVRDRNVVELSDNLTANEYATFYKGWDIWWWTFNEKDDAKED